MKKTFYLSAFFILFTQILFSQATYTALKVSLDNAPKIDGEIDAIWTMATMALLEQDVDDGDRTTEKDPAESDYKAEFGMCWSDSGLYILTRLNDDVYVNDNGAYWYRDDDVNFLIPPDLTSTGVTPLEFAWLVKSNTEGKAIPYQNVPEDAVSAAWSNSGTVYILEVHISWRAFFTAGTSGSTMLFEARARDDDKDGEAIYPQSFLQWSTDKKSVESDGIGMGIITLSPDEATSIYPMTKTKDFMIRVFPNPADNRLHIEYQSDLSGPVHGSVLDMSGKEVLWFEDDIHTDKIKTIDISSLEAGIYFIITENAGKRAHNKLSIIR